jgi:hypothetical protein
MMRRMMSATRVVCNKEGNGNGYKSNGDKGDGQVMATRAMVTAMATTKATTWVMVMGTRLAGNKEDKGKGGKGDGDDDEGGRRQRGQGRQGDGNGNKGGGQADGIGNKESNGGDDKIRGHRGGNDPPLRITQQ